MAAKTARRRSRELALQGLYSWHLTRASADDLVQQLSEARGFDKADRSFFEQLLRGCIDAVAELESLLQPLLDRKPEALSPVERSILMLGAWELKRSADVPYRVVINEAVELAKIYGGTDGHKYVNGVLDKLARTLREEPGAPAPAA